MKNRKKAVTEEQQEGLISVLESRFKQHVKRHEGLEWAEVESRLLESPEKLWSLYEMEHSGGAPDVMGVDQESGEYLFIDCSPDSPEGRRKVCYDREGLESRKQHKPLNSAMDMAADMGIELLTEEQYLALQEVGEFDLKTSSWIQTPPAIRKLGGALFGDRRYNQVFIYHNGAQSYYGARGFRGCLWV